MSGPTTVNGSRETFRSGTARIWRYRAFLVHLVVRNIRVKYRASILGFGWTLLNPIIMLSILLAVFTHIIKIPIEHYWAFLVSGFFAWNYINQTLNHAAQVLEEHDGLVRNYPFPTEITVYSGAISKLVEFSIEIVLVTTVLLLFHHKSIPLPFVLLPVLIALQLMLVIGLSLVVAVVSVYYEDVKHMLPLLLMALFYVSPVFYTVDLVPESVRTVFLLNPVAQLLVCYQSVLYHGTMPSIESLAALTLSSVVFFIVGAAVYRKHGGLVAEIV